MFARTRTVSRKAFFTIAMTLLVSLSANATNHFIRINEIMTGYNGDSSIQFIEFVVSDSGQKAWGPVSTVGNGPSRVGRAQIEFFDGVGNKTGRFVFPTNAPAGALTVLVATQEFATLTGIVPDFIMPKGMLQPNAGRVVYGQNPNSSGAFLVTLSVSYGGTAFTMPNDSSGAPNAATVSMIGGMSLSRTTNFNFGDPQTNNNSNFQLRVPTPCNTQGSSSTSRLTNLAGDAGLPTAATLAKSGENIFLKETFRGNGRTCATCHAPQHQFGMPPLFVASLPNTDPLFIHEQNVNTIVVNDTSSIIDPAGNNSLIAETNRAQPSDFVLGGTITDGSGNTAKVLAGTGSTYRIVGGQTLVIGSTLTDSKNNKARLVSFTAGSLAGPTPTNGLADGLEFSQLLRGTGAPSGVARALVLENINGITEPHVFRGSPTLVSIKHTAPYGLSGEFANLQDFSAGAIAQHFPLSMNRVAGVDFRNATTEELQALEAFQNSILTPADENFDESNQFNRFATTEKQKRGRDLFFGTAKCSACHSGKALSHSDGQFGTQLGVNENFNTGVAHQSINVTDGLPSEHALGGPPNSREFNTPTLFNIRKTAPFFHDNSANTLTHAVEFYDSLAFDASPARAQIGSIIEASDPVRVQDIVAFLESLTDLPFNYTRELQFAQTFLGQTTSLSVTLTNSGTQPLNISNLTLRGDHPDEFGHMEFAPNAGPIAPGQQRTVEVLFSPTHSGTQTANFEFDVSDGTDVYEVGVALTGTGSLQPSIIGTQANQPVDDNGSLQPFSTVEVSNASPTDVLRVAIDFLGDTGTLSGGGFVSQGVGMITFEGNFEAVTAAMQALVFAPFSNTFAPGDVQEVTFTIAVENDLAQSTDSSTTVIITSVNDLPQIQNTIAGQQTTDDAQIRLFETITINDDDRPEQQLTTTITLDVPSLGILSGSSINETSPGVYQFIGTASEATQELSNIQFVPANNTLPPGEQHAVTFTVEVDDGFAVTTDAITTVTVTSQNDAPVLAGAHPSAQISDLSNFLPFGVAVVSDADSPGQTLDIQVVLDDENKGAMFGAFTDFGGGTYGFSGSAAEVSLALRTLVFKPAQNRVLPGQTETTTFDVILTDSFDQVVFSSAASITTFSVNDQPIVQNFSLLQTTNDRAPFKLFANVNIVDADAFNLPITVTVTQDFLEKGQLVGAGFTPGDSTPAVRPFTFTGTLAQVNAALHALTYVPVPNRVPVGNSENSEFSIAVTDGDLGFTVNQLLVQIVSVNDAPTFTKGPHQIVLEDSGTKTIPNWASAISPGTGSEAQQNVAFQLASEDATLFQIQPAIAPNGTLTFTPAPDASGTVLVTVLLKDDGGADSGGSDSSTPEVFSITVVPVNEIPVAVINNNPSLTGIAGIPVRLDGSLSLDPDGQLVSYVWNFGDGTAPGSGPGQSHRYTAAGTYAVTLTVTDNEGATATVTQQIVIVAGDGGGPTGDADGDTILNQDDSDADGDGFSNDIEITAGSSAFDSASTPFGAGGAVAPEPLNVTKMLIGLNFSSDGKDSIQLSGTLPVPDKAVLAGAKVLLNIGGVAQTFTLNSKGQGREAASSFFLQAKAKNGVIAAQTAKFSAKLAKGTFQNQLLDEKISIIEITDNAPRTVLVALIFDSLGKHYQQIVDVKYTARNGKGKAKK